jgi:hypothetical protein
VNGRGRPVNQVEVEQRIDELTDKLEQWVSDYELLAEHDAHREADWKMLMATALLQVDGEHDRPSDAKGREARAARYCRSRTWVASALDCPVEEVDERPDPYRLHLIAAARREHAKEAIRSTAAMLSAQQTLLRSLATLTS